MNPDYFESKYNLWEKLFRDEEWIGGFDSPQAKVRRPYGVPPSYNPPVVPTPAPAPQIEPAVPEEPDPLETSHEGFPKKFHVAPRR